MRRLPGHRTRRLAARMFSAWTMDHLVDPVIADLQKEYADALSDGRVWQGRVAVVAGYCGLARGLLLRGFQQFAGVEMREGAEDRRAIVWSLCLIIGVTAILAVIPMLGGSAIVLFRLRPDLLLYLIPQTLPVAIPVGLALGIGA